MGKAKSAAKRSPFAAIDPLPSEAWGLGRCPRALASSDRAHALLGLGYPHMLLTTDGELPASDVALRALMDKTRIVPRVAVDWLYRVYSLDPQKKIKLDRAVKHQFREYAGNQFAMFALEHLFGASATATAFVDELERMAAGRWKTKPDPHGVALRTLVFVLWRTPPDVHAALTARIAAIYAKLANTEDADWRWVRSLDIIVNGRAGIEREREGMRPYFEQLLYANDPAWVAKITLDTLLGLERTDREMFTIQLGVIGGPRVIQQLRNSTAKFQTDQNKLINLQLSLCA